MPAVYVPEENDDAYERAVQELVEAEAEGRRAGLAEQRFESNPFYTFEPEHLRWIAGWREGLAQVLQPRRAA